MTEIKQQFIQAKTKSNFEARLKAGDIKDTSIVFIEDSDQIWAKGKYYSAIPKEGHERQILAWKASGEAKWEDLASMFTGLEEVLCYGVQFDMTVADPHLTRIGNMSLHKSLPIQSQLKGCIAQGSKIIYWLNESDWRFRKKAVTLLWEHLKVKGDIYTLESTIFNTLQYDKQWIKYDGYAAQVSSINTSANTATLLVDDAFKERFPPTTDKVDTYATTLELGAVLNGYDGTVRVYCPALYIKSVVDGNIAKVWLSSVKIDDTYTYQPEILIDAYKSTVLNTVPENMGYLSTLPVNSAISVVNTNEYCRGGGNRSDYDQYLATDLFRTDLGKPRTHISRANMRTYARNADSQMLSYDQYKNIFYWLYVVEYANFNSQEDYNATLTDEGYRQGGMGAGIVSINQEGWYNDSYPITPCGHGNTLGNGTGLVSLTIPEFTYTHTSTTVEYYEKVQSVANIVDSTNNGVTITKVIQAPKYIALRGWSYIVFGETVYEISGLTDGQTITFSEKRNDTWVDVATTSVDGSITVNWSDKGVNDARVITFGKVQDECNITIYASSIGVSHEIIQQQNKQMPRWRGFDNPFGDNETVLDGIVITGDQYSWTHMNSVYTCQNASKYADTRNDFYAKVGDDIQENGYTKSFDLGDAAHIIPHAMGGDTTKYICDYHSTYTTSDGRFQNALAVGGNMFRGAKAGLGSFAVGGNSGESTKGFRTVSEFVSFPSDK